MKNREDARHLAEAEVDMLQGCLDSLLTTHRLPRQCEKADLMAKALLLAYARGVRDAATLIGAANAHDGSRPSLAA